MPNPRRNERRSSGRAGRWLAFCLLGWPLAPPSVVVTPVADTSLHAALPDTNHGGEPSLRVAAGTRRALLRFDPEAVAAAPERGWLAAAVLRLHVESVSGYWWPFGCVVGAHPVDGDGRDWTEWGATWNCADGSAPADAGRDCAVPWAGGTFSPLPTALAVPEFPWTGWMELDVTADLRSGRAPAGWVLKCERELLPSEIRFTAREGAAAQRPRLVLIVAGPRPTVVPTPSASPTLTRTALPAPPPTETATRTASETPTQTSTVTPSLTQTPPPSATATVTPTSTFTPSDTPTPTETFTMSPTPMPTATWSPSPSAVPTGTPTAVPTATATVTETPVVPGLLVGQVFDDATSLPLANVRVRLLPADGGAPEADVSTDADGRYVLPALPGVFAIELRLDGYTRAVRVESVAGRAGRRVRDARLTRLAPAIAGGVVRAGYRPAIETDAAAVVPIELVGTQTDAMLRLTPLGPQGLVAPVPPGWSVLFGIDVDVGGAEAAVLRVARPALPDTVESAPVMAVWDDVVRQWIAGRVADISLPGDAGAILELAPVFSGQVAVLVADPAPNAPPPAVPGTALGAVGLAVPAAPTGVVRVRPEVIVMGDARGSDVRGELFTAGPLPSGTLLEARLAESYQLIDGRQVLGAASRQDVAVYRVGLGDEDMPADLRLAGVLRVRPSRAVDAGMLAEGRIAIGLALPPAAEDGGLVDRAGGVLDGPNGVQVVVPADAVEGTVLITLRPGEIPAGMTVPAGLIATIALDVRGGTLVPEASLALRVDAPVSDGATFVIGRLAPVDGRWVWLATAFGRGVDGRVVLDACAAGPCLPGVAGGGIYAVFAFPTDPAVVAGTVQAGGAVLSGVVVESDSAAVGSLTDDGGTYLLPLPLGQSSRLWVRDVARDLAGSTSATARAQSPPVTADIELSGTAPLIVGIDPPNHASQVSATAFVTITFSEPISAAVLQQPGAITLRQANAAGDLPVAGRVSLGTDGATVVFTPAAPLPPGGLFRLRVTAALTDRAGTPLSLPAGAAWVDSDFTTAAAFEAERLPPGTLRVSLPDFDAQVVVCAGAGLAVPGDDVIVRNETSGVARTVFATTADGVAGSDACAACGTDGAGSFCAAVGETRPGDRIVVVVRDAFGAPVTIDAPPMRDERTGATVVGAAGGAVSAAAPDEDYRVVVPAGAFDTPVVVTVAPAVKEDFPPGADGEQLAFAAGVSLDFGGHVPQVPVDLAVPAPVGTEPNDDPYLVTQVINVRGDDELTTVDVAYLDAATSRITTDDAAAPPMVVVTDADMAAVGGAGAVARLFDATARFAIASAWGSPYAGSPKAGFQGIAMGGKFAVLKGRNCTAFVTGWAAAAQSHGVGMITGPLWEVPFARLQTAATQFTVPVVCDRPIELALRALDGAPIDFLSLEYRPKKGEFVWTERRIGGDKTPPAVIAGQVAPSPGDCDAPPCAPAAVGHDADVSIPFSEAIAGTNQKGGDLIDPYVTLRCLRDGVWQVVHGTWSQSRDGRRIFFTAKAGRPLHGLPLGTACKVEVAGGSKDGIPTGIRDRNGNALQQNFEMRFETFQPRVVGGLTGIDALSISQLGWFPRRRPPALQRQYLAVGEGESARVDGLAERGGVVLADVTDPSRPAMAGMTEATPGMDWAVRVVDVEELRDAQGVRYGGPFLISVDGAGVSDPRHNRELFGVWRLLGLGDWPRSAPAPIFSRVVNQSVNSFETLNSQLPSGDAADSNRLAEYQFLQTIDNWIGLPTDVSHLGVEASYLANPWYLGVQAIRMNGFELHDPNRTNLPKNGSDGRLIGDFRAVATLKQWVIGVEPRGLVVADTGLTRATDPVSALWGGLPVMPHWVLGLSDWPVDLDRDGKIGPANTFDLVVTACNPQAPDLCVAVLDPANHPPKPVAGSRPPPPNGRILLPPDSQPAGAVADPIRRLLYVANGTLGVTVVDVRDPSGELDDDEPFGIDDRVLYTVRLPNGAKARRIDYDVSDTGRTIGYVATGDGGLSLVDLGPARMEVRLEGIPAAESSVGSNRVDVDTVRYFNEWPSTIYEPALRLPGHLAERFPDTIDVVIAALDRDGQPVQPPPADGRTYAPTRLTVSLPRLPQTDRYRLNVGSVRDRGVLVSNLPVAEIQALTGDACPSASCLVVYGGIGGSLQLAAQVQWPDGLGGDHVIPLEGRVREIPLEKVGIVLLGVDGLRQDVFYEEGREDVHDPAVAPRIRLDPNTTPGFAEIMGGVPRARLDGMRTDVDGHSLRIRGASAIFPSITLASWASVLSGYGPVDTGQLGNEFFDRRMAGSSNPGVPGRLNAPPGMVTYSNGAFPGYDTYSVSEKKTWDFVPPGDPSPQLTPQNREWTAVSLFQNLVDGLPGYPETFGPVIVEGAHYAKGAGRWLTVPDSWVEPIATGGVGAGADCYQGDENACATFTDRNFLDHLDEYLLQHAGACLDGRERFPGLLMLYQMGPDHVAHERGLGDDYRSYLSAVTGEEILTALRRRLIDIQQYYNKIFVLVADHGHTESGASGEREEWTEDNRLSLPEVDFDNHHMHIDEFVALAQQVGKAISPPRRFNVLHPRNLHDPKEADLVVAFDGPMAHVYVRSTGPDGQLLPWAAPACQEDRDAVGNGIVAALGGEAARFGTSSDFHAEVTQPGFFKSLEAAVDFVLVRTANGYVVRKPGPLETPLPTVTPAASVSPIPPTPTRAECVGKRVPPTSVQEFPPDEYFSSRGKMYVDAAERIQRLNHLERAGDVVIVFRNLTDDDPRDRYISSGNVASWHGSLNRSDSYVPFIVSYPGGNAESVRDFVRAPEVCGAAAAADGAPQCQNTLKLAPLVRRILCTQIEGAQCDAQ